MVAPICWTMTGARPSVGSSSSSRRAPVRRMRPMASICCSPPESLVPWLVRRSRRLGNSSRTASSVMPPGPDLWRQEEVLLHVEAGEDAALLRAERHPQPGDAVRREPDGLVAVEHHRALAARHHPHQRAQGGGLPRAVPAEQGHQLAGANLEVHAVEDVTLAVPGLEPLDVEQRAGDGLRRRSRRGGHRRLRHAPPPCTPGSRPCSSRPPSSRPRPGSLPGRAR